MIMAVHAAGVGAPAHLHGVHPHRLRLSVRTHPIAVSPEAAHRRPIRHRRWGRRAIERLEVARTVNNAAANYGEVARRAGDLAFGAGEEVAVRNDHIRELPGFDPAFLTLLVGEPGDVLRPHPKRGLAIQTIALRIKAKPAHRPARHEPGQRDPGIVRGNPGGVRASGELDALVEALLHRRPRLGGAEAIALHEILALIGHPVLHGDATTKRRDSASGLIRYALRV